MSKRNTSFNVERISILAILTALAYVGRILLQFIPNVQPVTAILIIIALTLGMTDGLIVATASIFLSNLMLGMGPWTFAQIMSFAAIILLTVLLMKWFYPAKNKWWHVIFSVYAFITGILYGFIISFISVKLLGINNFWAYYVAGVPFDLMHGMGNFAFYFFLEPVIAPLIMKQTQKK